MRKSRFSDQQIALALQQADAIRVAGWFGLLTLGLLWPIGGCRSGAPVH